MSARLATLGAGLLDEYGGKSSEPRPPVGVATNGNEIFLAPANNGPSKLIEPPLLTSRQDFGGVGRVWKAWYILRGLRTTLPRRISPDLAA